MPKVSIRTLDSVTHNDTTATTLINENFAALQEAIENTVSRDGSTPNFMDANLDLNSYKIINAGDPENDHDVITKGWFDQFVEDASTAASTANAAAERAASSAQSALVSAQTADASASLAQAEADLAEDWKDLAKDWATKTDGTVDGVDYSSKYYAQQILPMASDIAAVVANETNINAVAGNETNITAVAENETNINAVAANEANINAVSDDLTNIDNVAGDLTKINAVADDLTNIDSVADDLTNIDAVASNETNINTTATNIASITSVAGNTSNINAVAGNETNINTVAGISSDVSTTASIASDVSAVAANNTDISAVADDLTNIDTVATDISNVNATGSNIANVNAVADNETNINAVNANKTNIDTVATNITDINAVAADLANIDAAPTYAAEAKQWAIGVPSEPSEGSAKYWAGQAAAGQINSDWTEANTSSKAYILNKPTAGDNISFANNTISTVSDATPTQYSTNLVQSGGVFSDINSLQQQIDAIVTSSDVFDIVADYTALQAYDITTVPVNDIVKVLTDSTHNDAATYYRCTESGGVKSWSYVGSEGPYYTKGEADVKFAEIVSAGASLDYTGTTLSLENSSGTVLSSVTIQSSPDLDGKSITKNSSQELQTVGVINSRDSSTAIKTWTGTKNQFDAIVSKDSNTLYNITDDTDVSLTILEALYPVGSIYITTANTCPLSALISGSTWTLVSSGIVQAGDIPCKGNGSALGTFGLDNNVEGYLTASSSSSPLPGGIFSSPYNTTFSQYIGMSTDTTKSGVIADTSSLTLAINIFERTA